MVSILSKTIALAVAFLMANPTAARPGLRRQIEGQLIDISVTDGDVTSAGGCAGNNVGVYSGSGDPGACNQLGVAATCLSFNNQAGAACLISTYQTPDCTGDVATIEAEGFTAGAAGIPQTLTFIVNCDDQ